MHSAHGTRLSCSVADATLAAVSATSTTRRTILRGRAGAIGRIRTKRTSFRGTLAPLLTRTRDLILVIAGLTAACVIMLWPVVRSATHALPGELRDPLLEAWTLAWNADHIRHFFRSGWDLPILYPYP